MPTTVSTFDALISGRSWLGNGQFGRPVFLTYSFDGAPADYLPGRLPQDFIDSFRPFTDADKALARVALGAWEEACGVTFFEVPSGMGDLRFGSYNLDLMANTANFSAFAYLPIVSYSPDGAGESPVSGDIFVDYGRATFDTLLHEIGHALGLKHPFEGDTLLETSIDNVINTVMSYTITTTRALRLGDLDIQAAIKLYGRQEGDGTEAPIWSWDPFTFVLRQQGGEAGENLNGVATADILSGGGGDDYIMLRAGDDSCDGNAGGDTISAGFGRDTVSGGDGNDDIDGDEGDDSVAGGVGADDLRGFSAADYVLGGPGDDRIYGYAPKAKYGVFPNDGANYLRGDEGDDLIEGGSAFDDINGNMGADTASGEGGDDWVVGGKDGDLLRGDQGDDLVYGNLGADTCDGGDGADIVRGGQDNDSLSGGAGADFLSGDRGDDTVSGGAGADTFATFGEAGMDRVLDFNLAEGDRVQLLPGTTHTATQVGADVVIAMGGGGQMVLVGVQLSGLTGGWIFGG